MANLLARRVALMRDARYVRHLQKVFNEQLGFLSDGAVIERIRQGNVSLALENGEPAGYLLGATEISAAKHIRPVFQAAVQMDAQRRHHGLALLNDLTTAAISHKQTIIQCFCRQNLEANDFWRAAGFVPVALRDVNAARQQPCILWRKPLARMTAETLLWMPPNARNQTGGGRSVRAHDWSKLPLLSTYATADIAAALRELQLAA